MRWITFRDDSGQRTGVLSGDGIHALQSGVSLLELIGRGVAGLREAGEDALRSAPTAPPHRFGARSAEIGWGLQRLP